MKFDTAFIDLTQVNIAICNIDNSLFLKIAPIQYTDNKRNPRLPRKHSKQTNLQADTNHIFAHAFNLISGYFSTINRYKVNINIFKSGDKLGTGDLDNYCKAILDGITSTQKIWADDKQVDELFIKRHTDTTKTDSFIELTISKLS